MVRKRHADRAVSNRSRPPGGPRPTARAGTLVIFICTSTAALVLAGVATAAPRVSIVSPKAGATVSGIVSWRVKATPRPRRVKFRVDGRLRRVDRRAPYKYRWNTRRFANGYHVLAARAVWRVNGRTVRAVKKRRVKVRNTRTKLAWAPPELSNPVVVNVADDQWYVAMDRSKDYIVKIGHHRRCAPAGDNRAGLWLEGGRNVVLIGGRISIPCESTAYGRTGIKIRYATGTVHVEGVVIDNSGGWLTDGIAIAAPEAVVQLQNLRIGPVWEKTSAHPDLVQVQGGVKELRVDKLTGITTYQGFFLRHAGVSGCAQTACTNGPSHFRRVNVRFRNDLGMHSPVTAFFQATKDIPVTIGGFYVNLANTPRELGYVVHPTLTYVWDGDATRRAKYSPDRSFVYWPSSNIEGVVRPGAPSRGDYVPSGRAGQRYVAPGYR